MSGSKDQWPIEYPADVPPGRAALRLLEEALTLIDAHVEDDVLGARLSDCINRLKGRLGLI